MKKTLALATLLSVALAPALALAAGPNDAQIAAIVVTANQVESPDQALVRAQMRALL